MKRLEKIKKVIKNTFFEDYPTIITIFIISLIFLTVAFLIYHDLKILLIAISITFILIDLYFIFMSFKHFKVFQIVSKINTTDVVAKEIKITSIKFLKKWHRYGYKLIGLEMIDEKNEKYYFVVLEHSVLSEKLINTIKNRTKDTLHIRCYESTCVIENIDEMPDYLFK